MKKAVILDQSTFGDDPLDWRRITDNSLDWQIYPVTSPEQTMSRVKDASVVLSNKVVLDETVISQCPDLKYIGVLATGMNNVDVNYARDNGIVVQNVEAYGTASVVQHTWMLILTLAGNFVDYQRQVKADDWSRADMFCLLNAPIVELSEKHLVIVGSGELGQGVAKIAQAFGMKVTFAARPGQPATQSRPALDDILPSADVVSLHCLLSDETHHLFNAARLHSMKPSAMLINTARGPLVDEVALLDALHNGEIAGAAVDVLATEPPAPNHPLISSDTPNLIVTPHNAWASFEARQRLLNIAGDHITNFMKTNA